jgi:hypothetical protein
MNTAPYATPEGIRTYLVSMERLHVLREERRSAAARFELMPAYCILGRYLLTEDGRFGELVGVSAGALKDSPDVVTLEEYDRRGRRIYGEKWCVAYRTPAPLAPHDGLCPECGRGWTYAEIGDVVEDRHVYDVLLAQREGWVLTERRRCVLRLHVRCHEAVSARDALWWAEDAIERAGFLDASAEPCAALKDGFGRWFRLTTGAGTIRFGPRGRGYGIDWQETGRELMGVFCRIEHTSICGPVWNEPPVPHGPFHVDPKDETYLILYLDRLRQSLGL